MYIHTLMNFSNIYTILHQNMYMVSTSALAQVHVVAVPLRRHLFSQSKSCTNFCGLLY
ncbi:hypothetical protein Hanom_Chr06g00561961 [Helianthus anomalus]